MKGSFTRSARVVVLVSAVASVAEGAGTAATNRSEWYWDEGEARPFVAARARVGAVARAQVEAGYGKPHWAWVGIGGDALSTTEFGAGSVVLTAALPIFEVSVAHRWTASYSRGFLAPKERFHDDDLGSSSGLARYRSLDLDVSGVVPLPHVLVVPWVSAIRVLDAPAGRYVYEEYDRLVVASPWVVAARCIALGTWGERRRFGVGLVGEHLWAGRSSETTRVGPAAQIGFTTHTDFSVLLSWPVAGPDSFGAFDGAWGTAVLRWKWASGEAEPAFP